jgi:hypothetical protein
MPGLLSVVERRRYDKGDYDTKRRLLILAASRGVGFLNDAFPASASDSTSDPSPKRVCQKCGAVFTSPRSTARYCPLPATCKADARTERDQQRIPPRNRRSRRSSLTPGTPVPETA